jgi:putative membrane protein
MLPIASIPAALRAVAPALPVERPDSPLWFLADVNASLNALSTILIVAGLVAISRRNEALHKKLMLSAAATSAVFLASYLVYHNSVGSVPYGREGTSIRTVYLVILFSHIVLAAIQLPLILRTLWLGWRIDRVAGQGEVEARLRTKHRRIAKWTAPIWLYVSITGVVVYLMLYHF